MIGFVRRVVQTITATLGRCWRWLMGANRQRTYRNAIDVYIEQSEERLDDLEMMLSAYEERADLLPRLEEIRRRRAEG